MHGMTYLVIPFIFHNADGGINRASVLFTNPLVTASQ